MCFLSSPTSTASTSVRRRSLSVSRDSVDLGDGQDEHRRGLEEQGRLACDQRQCDEGADAGDQAAEPTAAPLAITAAR